MVCHTTTSRLKVTKRCVRAILNDASAFPSPERFDPMHFLDAEGNIIDDKVAYLEYAFGFGKRCVLVRKKHPSVLTLRHISYRRCPGRHLVEDVVFIFAASVMAIFDIQPPAEGFKEPALEGFIHV